MKKIASILAFIFVFQLFVYAQTLDGKLKEIDDYASYVISTWK